MCKLADLDSSVSFFSVDTDFIVAFNLQNISESPCVPQPSVAFPQFHQGQVGEATPFDLCTDCEDRLPNGQYRVHDPVVLSPGETGHQTYRWKTVPATETVKCLRLRALFTPVLIVAPTLFKEVCSEIAVSRTYVGAFVPPKDERHSNGVPEDQPFVLSSGKARYYQNEIFTLHVGLVNWLLIHPPRKMPHTLPARKIPDGDTRFDEVSPSGFKMCKSFRLGADRNADWHSGFEVESGVLSRWAGLGEHSFEVFQAVDSSGDGRTHFVRSNKLTVQIDDSALIPRKWQGKLKGVGVDVTLDKDAYQLGEDVPLHIAIENFDAPVPIYAIDPSGVLIRLLVSNFATQQGAFCRKTKGLQMKFIGRATDAALCPIPPEGWSPWSAPWQAKAGCRIAPGVYTVVVTWCPLDGTHFESGSGLPRNSDIKTYATVQAVTTFRIVGEPSRPSHLEP